MKIAITYLEIPITQFEIAITRFKILIKVNFESPINRFENLITHKIGILFSWLEWNNGKKMEILQMKPMMIFKKQADVYYWHIHSVRPVQAGCWDAFWITWLTLCCPQWHISDTDILTQKCYTCQCHPQYGSFGGLRHDSRFRILLLIEESILTLLSWNIGLTQANLV